MLYCEGGDQCLCSQLAYEVDILVCTQIKEIKKTNSGITIGFSLIKELSYCYG